MSEATCFYEFTLPQLEKYVFFRPRRHGRPSKLMLALIRRALYETGKTVLP